LAAGLRTRQAVNLSQFHAPGKGTPHLSVSESFERDTLTLTLPKRYARINRDTDLPADPYRFGLIAPTGSEVLNT
jgi:hypothetical protein